MAARRQLEHLEGLFEDAPIGLGILDRSLRFTHANRALVSIFGLPRDAHLGKTPQELLPDLGPELTEALRRVASAGETVNGIAVGGSTPDNPSVRRVWVISAYPVCAKTATGTAAPDTALDTPPDIGRDETTTAAAAPAPPAPDPAVGASARDAFEAIALVVAPPGAADTPGVRLDDAAARSQLLNDFYIAAVRRHTDEREILDLLAQRAAQGIGDAAFVSIVRDGRLETVAASARDREQRRVAERLLPFSHALDDLRRDRPPVSDRTVVISGVSDEDYAVLLDQATASTRPFFERFRAQAVLMISLRVEGRAIGSIDLVRTDPARPDYSREDVAFAEALALRASLVLENARGIVERESMRRRAEVTAEFLESVVESGDDERNVLRLLAQHSARAIGDVALVVTRDSEGGWLEMAALESSDLDLDAAVRQRLEGRRISVEIGGVTSLGPDDVVAPGGATQAGFADLEAFTEAGARPDMDALPDVDAIAHADAIAGADALDDGPLPELDGRGLDGADAAGEDGLDSPGDEDDPAGLDAVAGPEGVALREIVEAIAPSAVIAQPLHAGGQLAGALVMLRGEGMRPYDADEVDMIRNLAGRASLALDNVRTHVALHRTAARLATIFEESPVATVELDAALRVTRWNRAAEELFGWTEDEVRGRPIPNVPADRAEEIADIARRTLAGEVIRGLETVRMKRDGTRVQVATYDAAINGPDGRPTGIILRLVDIDERKSLEAELLRTSETLRAILDASPLAVTAVDLERRVIYWSKGAERLYGWSSDEAFGAPPPYLLRNEPDPLEGYLGRVKKGESVVMDDIRRIAKNGEVVTVRVFAAPIRGAKGEVVGMLGIHEDLRSQRRLEAELFEARKMESVGRLAGGIAHDFNNILTAIIGFSDLALSEQMTRPVEAALTTIKASAERAAGLTQQLLAFSRRQMLQPQVLDPNEVVIRMEAILRQLIGEQIDLAISVTPAVGSIRVDRTQLEQVILNLALNARDAMPGGGRLVIRTEHVRFDETSLSRHFEMTPGDYVQISVSDTGIGMDETTKAQIFEPFFTTKAPGAGTGLGLATTYGIVKQSGGYIWVYSEPGRGTSFKLHFPAIPDELTQPGPVENVSGRRSGRILLVEDEPLLRELGRQVLVRQGYDVVVAANGIEAVRLVEAGRARGEPPFDLLMTDVVMPRVSGTELARRFRQSQPDLRVLLMSGYAEEIAGGGVPEAAFLAKPFTPDTLLRTVDEVLGERGRARQR